MLQANLEKFAKAFEIATDSDGFTQAFVSKLYRHEYTYTDGACLAEIEKLLTDCDIEYTVTLTNEYRDGSKEYKVEIK